MRISFGSLGLFAELAIRTVRLTWCSGRSVLGRSLHFMRDTSQVCMGCGQQWQTIFGSHAHRSICTPPHYIHSTHNFRTTCLSSVNAPNSHIHSFLGLCGCWMLKPTLMLNLRLLLTVHLSLCTVMHVGMGFGHNTGHFVFALKTIRYGASLGGPKTLKHNILRVFRCPIW